MTRAFFGQLGRPLRTDYTVATERSDAAEPFSYTLQRSATGPTRSSGTKENDLARI